VAERGSLKMILTSVAPPNSYKKFIEMSI